MHSSTVVLESQPDWLTAVFVGDRLARSVSARVVILLKGEKINGNRELPFSLGEYTGSRCGRVRAGEMARGLLVQLSGEMAALHFDWFTARATRITRLDLAVTVQTARYDPTVAETAYAQASTFRQTHPRSAVPSLVLNGAGGSTCYIGKRTSDRYFRAYDKEMECRASDDPDATERYLRSWRFELELHDDAATLVARALPKGPARAIWIAGYIAGYQRDHGQLPIFDPLAPPVHVGGFRRRSDRESRLDWLSRSVAPSVRWLLDSVPRDELLERLGLAEEGGAKA